MTTSFDPPPFLAAFQHVPRFGNIKDPLDIFDVIRFDEDNYRSYIRGTWFIGAFFTAIMIIWSSIFIGVHCFKMYEKRRKEGSRKYCIRIPVFTSCWKKIQCSTCVLNEKYQSFIVLISSLVILMTGLLMATMGWKSYNSTTSDVVTGANSLVNITKSVVEVTQDLIHFANDTIPLRQEFMTEYENGICQSGAGGTADDINAAILNIIELVGSLQNYTMTEVSKVQEILIVPLNDVVIAFHRQADDAESWSLWILFPLVLILLIGSWLFVHECQKFVPSMAICKRVQRVQCLNLCTRRLSRPYFVMKKWILFPVVISIITLATVVIAFSSALMTIVSDTCIVETNENQIGLALLIQALVERGDLGVHVEEAIQYYFLDDCAMESPHNIKIESYFDDLQSISQVIESVEAALEEDSESIQQLCGLTEMELEELKPLFTAAFTAFGELKTIISNFRTITDCTSFNSSFSHMANETLCRSIPWTLLWAFIASTLVFTFGILTVSISPLDSNSMLSIQEEKINNAKLLPSCSTQSFSDDSVSSCSEERYSDEDDSSSSIVQMTAKSKTETSSLKSTCDLEFNFDEVDIREKAKELIQRLKERQHISEESQHEMSLLDIDFDGEGMNTIPKPKELRILLEKKWKRQRR
ncbi:predicted protein [Chaetoceros tenuissimus]|uniref:Uncharacterized protein n=1 Tax=Chaetoceros tenuissimus TaxID=426638 RepID=A0AAD3DBI1_9STRA|nr:predicted protein [Chaetoceros tenuissimus]